MPKAQNMWQYTTCNIWSNSAQVVVHTAHSSTLYYDICSTNIRSQNIGQNRAYNIFMAYDNKAAEPIEQSNSDNDKILYKG